MDDKNNTPEIYSAICAIMKDMGAIGKNKKNMQQGFAYRGIDDVMNVMQPLMAKHGIFVTPEVLEQTREERQSKSGSNLIYTILKIKFTFYAKDGSNIYAVTIGESLDSGDKSANKSMAVALKYAFFQVFCIPTEELKDPDAQTHNIKPKKITAKQVEQLFEASNKNADMCRLVLKELGYESSKDVEAAKFNDVLQAIKEAVTYD